MAVRNGANFIEEQIASILPQLGDKDEFVIIDDASNDNTIAIIESFRDVRIRIVRNEHNRGVVQSFGRALEEAKGEIIFLTDHDDIWRADKVEKFLDVFNAHPDITVVMSDLVIIDAAGRIVSEQSSDQSFMKARCAILYAINTREVRWRSTARYWTIVCRFPPVFRFMTYGSHL